MAPLRRRRRTNPEKIEKIGLKNDTWYIKITHKSD